MKLRQILVSLGILTALLGCVPVPEKGAYLSPDFVTLGVRRVAVGPVIFADEPLDWYFGERVAIQIRRETIRSLESKGYEAASVGETFLRYPPPGRDPASLAPPVPESADALLVVRLDHFLDAGRYNGGGDIGAPGTHFFEMYATAALVGRGGQILWQDEGAGRGSHNGIGTYLLDEFTVPADLARSLFDTLPAAR